MSIDRKIAELLDREKPDHVALLLPFDIGVKRILW